MEIITVTIITITLVTSINYGVKYFNKLDRIESIKRDRAGRFSRVDYTSNKVNTPEVKHKPIKVNYIDQTYYI